MGNSEKGNRTGAVSKSSLRRQISLSKIDKRDEEDKQSEGEIDELMEDTFVREPIDGTSTTVVGDRLQSAQKFGKFTGVNNSEIGGEQSPQSSNLYKQRKNLQLANSMHAVKNSSKIRSQPHEINVTGSQQNILKKETSRIPERDTKPSQESEQIFTSESVPKILPSPVQYKTFDNQKIVRNQILQKHMEKVQIPTSNTSSKGEIIILLNQNQNPQQFQIQGGTAKQPCTIFENKYIKTPQMFKESSQTNLDPSIRNPTILDDQKVKVTHFSPQQATDENGQPTTSYSGGNLISNYQKSLAQLERSHEPTTRTASHKGKDMLGSNQTNVLLKRYRRKEKGKKVEMLRAIKSSKMPLYNEQFQINISNQSRQQHLLSKMATKRSMLNETHKTQKFSRSLNRYQNKRQGHDFEERGNSPIREITFQTGTGFHPNSNYNPQLKSESSNPQVIRDQYMFLQNQKKAPVVEYTSADNNKHRLVVSRQKIKDNDTNTFSSIIQKDALQNYYMSDSNMISQDIEQHNQNIKFGNRQRNNQIDKIIHLRSTPQNNQENRSKQAVDFSNAIGHFQPIRQGSAAEQYNHEKATMGVGVDTASSGLAPDSYFRMKAGQYEQTLQTHVADNHFHSSKDEELSPTSFIKNSDGQHREQAFSSITQKVLEDNSPIPKDLQVAVNNSKNNSTNQGLLDLNLTYSNNNSKIEGQQPMIDLPASPLFNQPNESINVQQKQDIEELILSHITDSIVSPSNIQSILNAKNSLKLIRAADANYMNQTVYDKFAKTWAQREGINTDTGAVVQDCRQKINELYRNVHKHFIIQSQFEMHKMMSREELQLSQQQLSLNSQDDQYNLKPSRNFYNNINGESPEVINQVYGNQSFGNIHQQVSLQDVGVTQTNSHMRSNSKSRQTTQLAQITNVTGSNNQGENSNNPHQRIASQISGVTNPSIMSPSLNKQLDFNIQIKYKNNDPNKELTQSPYFGNLGKDNIQPFDSGQNVKLRTPIYPEQRQKNKFSASASKGQLLQSQQFNDVGQKKRPLSRIIKQPIPSSKQNTKNPSANPTEETEINKQTPMSLLNMMQPSVGKNDMHKSFDNQGKSLTVNVDKRQGKIFTTQDGLVKNDVGNSDNRYQGVTQVKSDIEIISSPKQIKRQAQAVNDMTNTPQSNLIGASVETAMMQAHLANSQNASSKNVIDSPEGLNRVVISKQYDIGQKEQNLTFQLEHDEGKQEPVIQASSPQNIVMRNQIVVAKSTQQSHQNLTQQSFNID